MRGHALGFPSLLCALISRCLWQRSVIACCMLRILDWIQRAGRAGAEGPIAIAGRSSSLGSALSAPIVVACWRCSLLAAAADDRSPTPSSQPTPSPLEQVVLWTVCVLSSAAPAAAGHTYLQRETVSDPGAANCCAACARACWRRQLVCVPDCAARFGAKMPDRHPFLLTTTTTPPPLIILTHPKNKSQRNLENFAASATRASTGASASAANSTAPTCATADGRAAALLAFSQLASELARLADAAPPPLASSLAARPPSRAARAARRTELRARLLAATGLPAPFAGVAAVS